MDCSAKSLIIVLKNEWVASINLSLLIYDSICSLQTIFAYDLQNTAGGLLSPS